MCTGNTGYWMKYDIDTPLPKTETHEALEEGRKLRASYRIVAKKQLNFQSYPMEERHYVPSNETSFEFTSSYKRDYPPPNPSICPPMKPKENDPHPLFNRRPVNDFVMRPYVCFKFMDDGLYNPSPGRKQINFFRQLRNYSVVFD